MLNLAPTIDGANDMLAKNSTRIFALGIILIFVAAIVHAQQKVYKWVDEEGVIHFSETPPDESESVETETLTTAKPPPYVPRAQPAIRSPAPSETGGAKQSAQPEIEKPQVVAKINIKKMSLADLNSRCADAREKKIAPLKEAEIAKCKKQDPDYPARCERFYADYGDGGRTVSGGFRPRMFHDLPECIEADQERKRRGQ